MSPQEKINKMQKSSDGKENAASAGGGVDPSLTGGVEASAASGEGGGGDRVGEKLYTGRKEDVTHSGKQPPQQITLFPQDG